jgi:signal transduction histidine kinase
MSEEVGDVALDEFVAVMVHDLNNPIAALGTNLRFLEASLGPSMSVDVVETLSDAQMLCEMLRRLVSNLGMIAKPGASMGKRLAIDPAVVAKDVVARLDKQAQATEVELELDAAVRPGRVFVECDREFCARAVDNLVAFAIERAVRRSKIVVTVVGDESPRLEVRFSPRPEQHETSAHPSRGSQLQAAYGRGLSLHSARLAAAVCGGRVDKRHESDGTMTLELALPTEDKQNA